MTNSVSASSFFPFDDNEICDLTPTATIEGNNKETGSYIAIDYRNEEKTLNRHKTILGSSGAGKSTYIKSLILRAIAEGRDRIFIIDPDNEYSDLLSPYDAVVHDLSSASRTKINPYQIFSSELALKNIDDDQLVENLIKQKIQRLKGFFKIIAPGITQVELAIISSISMTLYHRFREIKDISHMKNEDFPILEDLYKELGKLKGKDNDKYEIMKSFYFILEDYVYGSSNIFNGYTNISLDSQIVSFNLLPLQTEKDIQSAAYLNVFNYLWDEITSKRSGSTVLYCDEFHFLLLNEESADFFYQAFKRFRKYDSGAVVTTQQVEDVLKAPKGIGEAIIGNSYTKVIFGLDEREADVLVQKLKIPFSEKEINFIRRKKQGEALIIYGTQRAFLEVKLTLEELRLLNPKRYRKITGKDPNIIPNWAGEISLFPNEIKQFLEEKGDS